MILLTISNTQIIECSYKSPCSFQDEKLEDLKSQKRKIVSILFLFNCMHFLSSVFEHVIYVCMSMCLCLIFSWLPNLPALDESILMSERVREKCYPLQYEKSLCSSCVLLNLDCTLVLFTLVELHSPHLAVECGAVATHCFISFLLSFPTQMLLSLNIAPHFGEIISAPNK